VRCPSSTSVTAVNGTLFTWTHAPRRVSRPPQPVGADWKAKADESAGSDGGEDQGAEEVTVHGGRRRRRRIIITSVLERAVSRERLFLFRRSSGISGHLRALARAATFPTYACLTPLATIRAEGAGSSDDTSQRVLELGTQRVRHASRARGEWEWGLYVCTRPCWSGSPR